MSIDYIIAPLLFVLLVLTTREVLLTRKMVKSVYDKAKLAGLNLALDKMHIAANAYPTADRTAIDFAEALVEEQIKLCELSATYSDL